MAEQALYRKWRPIAFDEVVGQEHVVKTIRNALASGRAAHAYLFSGPRGTGKTTTARLVAKALNCTHPDPAQRPDNTCRNCVAVNEGRFLDLIEIDAASNTGVDNIRDLRDKINFAPGEGQYKVYIIDEVHMLSMGAFNALLKTLEEPPPHAVFILATTELHKVPLTVASRCQKHTFRRIPAAEVAGRLGAIVEREGLSVEPAVLDLLARQATGSLRDAISLLDQLIISPDEKVTLDGTLKVLGTASGQAVQELAEAMLAQDSSRGLDLINNMAEDGIDSRQFARQMVDYLRGLLLTRLGNAALVDAGAETRKTMHGQAARFDPAGLVQAIKAFNTAANDSRSGWLAQLPLELAFVECLRIGSTGDGVAPAAGTEAGATPSPRKAAPPLPPPPSTSAKPQSGSDVNLSQITARWADIVSVSGRSHRNLPALLQWCKPISLEGEIVVLGFQNEVLLSKTNTDQNRQLIEAALQQVLGRSFKVRCVLNSAQTETLPDVSSDGPVAEAIRLGGKLRK
ncbi:MAG: DNA polymerase III subunit gamma/tau [Chloroflexi bacterium]|nr:DNA polymerase III subunit gamma/tau [Chloroflexota bacterium]